MAPSLVDLTEGRSQKSPAARPPGVPPLSPVQDRSAKTASPAHAAAYLCSLARQPQQSLTGHREQDLFGPAGDGQATGVQEALDGGVEDEAGPG